MAYQSPVPITEVCDLLGINAITSRASFNIPCPICDDNTGSRRQEKHLNINIQDDVWCCPKCGSGGGSVHLYGFFAYGIDPQQLKKDKDKKRELYKEISEKSGNIDLSALQAKRVEIPKIDFPPTEISERDFTYNCFLRQLSLSEAHKENLLKRGLTEEIIVKKGYKSVPLIGLNKIPNELRMQDACNLQGVPGFYKKDGQWTVLKQNPGIFIPVRDIPTPEEMARGELGKIQGMQIRYDKEPRKGCKYMWFSTRDMESGSGAETWTHFVGYPEREVWITEGPLKGDIANMFLDEPFLCIPGVNAIYHLEPKLRQLMALGTRHVKTAFDMDYMTNKNVQRAYAKLIEMIKTLGLTYERVNWNPEHKGIDDHLFAEYKKHHK